jgi:hypothetical protein
MLLLSSHHACISQVLALLHIGTADLFALLVAVSVHLLLLELVTLVMYSKEWKL